MKRSLPLQKTQKKLQTLSVRKDDLSEYYAPNPTFYPNPLTLKRANEFNNGSRPRPLELLESKMEENKVMEKYDTVVHWFREDLRIADNTALSKAIKFSNGKPIHALYIINENDWIAHQESGWKLKFQMDALSSLSDQLAQRSIHLHVKVFKPELPKLSNSGEFCQWFSEIIHEIDYNDKNSNILITANIQYETDELYRDLRLLKQSPKYCLKLYHDKCIVPPGSLSTGKGSQYTIFTPWYKKWVAYLEANASEGSIVNIETLSKSIASPIPPQKIDYELPEKFTSYLPEPLKTPLATEHAAFELLEQFLQEKVNNYNNGKDLLNRLGTSKLSAYISSGLISTRQILAKSYHLNNNSLMNKDIKKNNSIHTFIKELAWRDFYKHVTCHWPFLCMDFPFKFETLDINWTNDEDHFAKWCYGETGVPIVDAIMKQLLATGYINNRSRMIVASFLSKNLLIDWRWGERWFRKHLIDYDLSSNIGGWGFCSSTGIDAQPYFRVFNMKLQSEKYDPDGGFIRSWLQLPDKPSVHVPLPTAIVDLRLSRERALERYREVM